MKNKIEIFFASDTNYLPYLSCALHSLSEHSSPDNEYRIHILTTDFSEKSLAETKKLVRGNITVSVHDLSERIAEIKSELSVRLRDYYSDSIYYRIFIPKMFPRLKKAVYLDADIILNDDVANLYNTDLGDDLLGAVTDESVVGIPIFCDYVKKQIGLADERDYFNSGVLVMNLAAMRDERLEEKFDIVLSILGELSDDFKSGYSFLAFNLTKYGKPWTDYQNVCEQLLVLAIGLGLAGFCSPREMWSSLPGNAPYIVIN